MTRPHPDALARRYEGYAALFLAETECAEPPRTTEPTDEALARIVSRPTLGRPARATEYDNIRAAIPRVRAQRFPTPDNPR